MAQPPASRIRAEPRQNPASGFTLVEVLVVIVVILVLVGLLFPAMSLIRRRANVLETEHTINALAQALDAYRLHHGHYPVPENGSTPRSGFLTSAIDPSRPRLLDQLRNGELFTWNEDKHLDDQRRLVDAFGGPIRLVIGDNANKSNPALPKDSNKPKDANKPAAESDWNVEDVGGYAYIYSTGPSGQVADWIYIRSTGGSR